MATTTAQPGPPPHTVPQAPQEATPNLPSLDSNTHEPDALHASTNGNDPVPRGPVRAKMNFFKPPEDGTPPHNYAGDYADKPPNGVPQRNFGDADHILQINDVRGKESSFSLDKHAFATLQGYPHNSNINWHDDESIKKYYYPEVEKILLENAPGNPQRVLLFDHTIRRAEPGAKRAPVNRCHIDQTPKSAKQRVEYHLPEEASSLLQGRYRIINVWRPLNGKVESQPLAFAASSSVPSSDMVAVEHRYPNRTGETAAVKYNPEHQWYYWSGVDNDERIFLQCFDSADEGNRVPHSAFVDPRSTEESKHRESIEVRALVFG